MADVLTREKDLRYSSRTRINTERFRESQKLRHAIAGLLEKLPAELKQLPEARLLAANSCTRVYNVVYLNYHNPSYEGYSKDFEFSRRSMEDHWQSGYDDTVDTLKHPQVLQRPRNSEGIAVYDFSRESNPEIPAEPSSKRKAA